MAKTQNMKMTEIGLIPQDWEICSIGSEFSFLRSNSYSRDQLNSSDGTVRNIHYGDILIKFGNVTRVGKDSIPYINSDVNIVLSPKNLLRDGDVIFADTAEDEAAGKTSELQCVGREQVVSGLHTIPIRPNSRQFAPGFLGYSFNAAYYHDQLRNVMQGTKVISISKKAVAETYLVYPSYTAEQKKIADALSDIDTLITSLDKAVKKKNLMKQGAMQQLLSGKVRLKGFSTPWVEVELRQTGVMKSGGTPSTLVSEYWNGNINWLQSGAVQNCYIYPSAVSQKITELGLSKSAAYLISHDSVLIALTGATCANVGYLTFDSAANQSVVSIEPYPEYSAKFLYQLLLTKRDLILQNRGGSAQGGVSLNQLKGITVTLPIDLEEQVEIAAILSAMDNEIAALEAERDKYKNIKQGMMQQLLTGQIRLPV